MKIPKGEEGAEFLIDSILDSEYGNETVSDMIDEYEEENGRKVVNAKGPAQELLKEKYNRFGKDYWAKNNPNSKLDSVLLEIPPSVTRKMFPNGSSFNWIVFLQSIEYGKDGKPVMETITVKNDMGKEVQTEIPKKRVWRIEYDYYDRYGQGSKVCSDKVTSSMWDKLLKGQIDRMKNGGMAEAICSAHKDNMEKNPAFKTIGAKVGSKIYKQKDPEGNDSLCFDIIVTDEYTPEQPSDEFAINLDTPARGGRSKQTI